MKYYHKRRMQKIIDFLKELPIKKFDFSDVVGEFDIKKECGTICCAMGWLPKIDPKNWKWKVNESYFLNSKPTVESKKYGDVYYEGFEEYLGIDYEDRCSLFYPYNDFDNNMRNGDKLNLKYNTNKFKNLGSETTPKQLARQLETYLNIAAK